MTDFVSVLLQSNQIFLQLYNNEWEFIEAENFRVLADNIFDAQDLPQVNSMLASP
jgi:hypothetical protein